MHNDLRLVEARIERELFERVLPAVYSDSMPMTVEAWDVPGEPVAAAEAVQGDYRPFTVGDPWSRPWGTTWFRFSVDIPVAWVGPRLEAVIDLGFHADSAGFQSEGLVWIDGRPVQGIHPRRTGVPLPHVAAGPFMFHVEAASNPAFVQFRPSPLGSLESAGDDSLYRLRRASLAQRDDAVLGLLLDVDVLFGLARSLQTGDPRRIRVLRQLESAFNVLDLDDVAATAAAARRMVQPALALRARAGVHRVVAVGHAHIDSAWLWPIRETQRKCARTFASAVRLMDDYPDYHFSCSQAAQYEWIEQQHPTLFEQIRTKVTAGQWHPVGGMWVEPDMNLPGGESIVRQLVFGQRYFESRFGARSTVVWMPDVFGYPATLPQIFQHGGCTRFITQKLSWNKQNVFPHSTFWWEGIDGSRVLTHFPPVDTYNAEITAAQVVYAEGNFKEHGWSNWSLMPFGHGNGGGGPTREMMERARRMADLDGASTDRGRYCRGVLRPRRGRDGGRSAGAGVGRRAVLRDASWHVDVAAADQGRQSALRASAARGRAVVGSGRRRAGHESSPSSSSCGRRCCCSSSTTSSPARRSPGSPPMPRLPTHASPNDWSRSSPTPWPASHRLPPPWPTPQPMPVAR